MVGIQLGGLPAENSTLIWTIHHYVCSFPWVSSGVVQMILSISCRATLCHPNIDWLFNICLLWNNTGIIQGEFQRTTGSRIRCFTNQQFPNFSWPALVPSSGSFSPAVQVYTPLVFPGTLGRAGWVPLEKTLGREGSGAQKTQNLNFNL